MVDKMAEENKPMLTICGTLMGREYLNKQGETKEGVKWKLYKVLIQEKPTDLYNKKISAFFRDVEGDGKFSFKGWNDVEEGDYVKVGYNEGEPYQAHGKTQIPKTATWIGKTEEGKEQPSQPQNSISGNKAEEATKDQKVLLDEDLQKFSIRYIQAVPDGERNLSHYIGAFMRTYHKELVAKAEDAYHKVFNQDGTKKTE